MCFPKWYFSDPARPILPTHSRPVNAPPAPPATQPSTPKSVISQPMASAPQTTTAGTRPSLAAPTPASATEATSNAVNPNPKTPQKAAALSLVIRATESSWVSVQADGKQVLEETLIAPARTTVRADREIVVRVGNAAGVSFLFNGIELAPQGNESEVKTIVFDPTGMKLPP